MVEKMKLVRVQGTMPQLNEFIGSCCMDGRFDLEPATRYMSESLGYGALNEENPHTAIRDQIETMAKEANMELHEGQQHSDPVDAEGRSYLSDLLEKIDDLCAERKVLLDQKKLCEDGIEQYSHFTGLKVNVDDILDCAHVKIRFGFLPTEGYNKLMNNYGDDPYILFTPCNQTKAGYWGVYMTPREHALETDGIFSMLYFEPVHVPGAAGSPARSSSTLKRTSTLSTRASRTSRPHCRPVAAKRRQGPAAVQHSLLLRGGLRPAPHGRGQGRALLLRRLGPGVGGGRGRGQGPRHPWAARHGGRTGIRR